MPLMTKNSQMTHSQVPQTFLSGQNSAESNHESGFEAHCRSPVPTSASPAATSAGAPDNRGGRRNDSGHRWGGNRVCRSCERERAVSAGARSGPKEHQVWPPCIRSPEAALGPCRQGQGGLLERPPRLLARGLLHLGEPARQGRRHLGGEHEFLPHRRRPDLRRGQGCATSIGLRFRPPAERAGGVGHQPADVRVRAIACLREVTASTRSSRLPALITVLASTASATRRL
jgi:hypothetical protein